MALQDENEAFYFIKNPNGKITVRITEKDDVYPGEIETGFFSLNKEEARRFIDKLEASAKDLINGFALHGWSVSYPT